MNSPSLRRGSGLWTLLCIPILALGSAVAASAADEAAPAASCPTFVESSEGLPEREEWRTHPAVADVNRDGRPDIAGHVRKGNGPRVWLQQKDGSWKDSSVGLKIPGTSCGVTVDFGDVNEDGHVDLGVAEHCNGIFVFLGDGGKTWSLAHSVLVAARKGYDALRFADLNGDGHLDLVASGAMDGGFAVYHGDGTGKWTQKFVKETGFPNVGFASDIEIADINGDGRADVAAAYSGGGMNPPPRALHRNQLWVSNGDGQHHPGTRALFDKGRSFGIAIGDVNGDGHADFAASRSLGYPLEVMLADGEGGWTRAVEGLPGEGARQRFWGVELEDVNGDGHLDLAAVDHPAAGVALWVGDGSGRWTACTETGLDAGDVEMDVRGWGLKLHDFDGDGRKDIVAAFGRNGEGSVRVWLQK